MSEIRIRKVLSDEAGLITELGMRSKAHWGYDEQFMQACREEMTHAPTDISDQKAVYRAVDFNGCLAGFYKIVDVDSPKVGLDALFVDPPFIGHGLGRALIEHAKREAKALGGRSLITQSDPYAEEFYVAMGGEVVGRLESGSIAGRFLPLVEISLS